MQIVEPCFRVVAVATVAEGVIGCHIVGGLGDAGAVGAVDACGIAPRVISVGGYQRTVVDAVPLVQGNDIALQVLGKIVVHPAGFAGVLDAKAYRAVVFVKGIPQGVLYCSRRGEPPFGHRQAVYDVVQGVPAIGIGFSRTQTIDIVLAAVGLAIHGNTVQFPAIAPSHGIPFAIVIAQGIAAAIVGDALPVKGRQQVLPVGIAVGVGVLDSCNSPCAILNYPRGQISGVVIVILIPLNSNLPFDNLDIG